VKRIEIYTSRQCLQRIARLAQHFQRPGFSEKRSAASYSSDHLINSC
jgi:hypothetical protein